MDSNSFAVYSPTLFSVLVPNSSFSHIFSAADYNGFTFSDNIILDFYYSISSLVVTVDIYISHSIQDNIPCTKYFLQSFSVEFSCVEDVSSDNIINNIIGNVWDKLSPDLFDYCLAMIQTEVDFSDYRSSVEVEDFNYE